MELRVYQKMYDKSHRVGHYFNMGAEISICGKTMDRAVRVEWANKICGNCERAHIAEARRGE